MGSSKKQTVGYFYYKDLAGVLCHGPVEAITRIECSDRQIMRENFTESGPLLISAGEVFGGKDREGGVGGTIDIMFGDEDQLPNQYMKSKISTAVNAMRGVVSVVFNRLYMGMNPYMRDFKFRVRRSSTGWYNEKSELNITTGGFINKKKIYIAVDFSTSLSNVEFEDVKISVINAINEIKDLIISGCDIHAFFFFIGSSSTLVGDFFDIDINNSSDLDIVLNFINSATRKSVFLPNVIMFYSEAFFETLGNENIIVACSKTFFTTDVEIQNFKDLNNEVLSKVQLRAISISDNNRIFDVDNTGLPKLYLSPQAIIDAMYVGITNARGYSYKDSDLNPAHIIRDILTNVRYGLGVPEIKIDDIAFRKMADTLFDEKMGMSIAWDGSSAIEDFINNVCAHICATMPYVDSESGLWTCKLLRDDYDVNSLLILNESNIIKCSEFTRKTMVDLVNTITVNYWDRSTGDTGTVTVDNTARIAQQGKVIANQIDYRGFTNGELASRVALRDLKTLSTPLASATLDVKRVASGLKVGDCFKWSWSDYGLDNAIMRVSSIKQSGVLSNYVTIECVEDSYSMPMQSVLPYVPPPKGNFEDASPNSGLLTEASYYELVQRYGQAFVDQQLSLDSDSGYVLATSTTNQNALNAIMTVSSGGGFEDVGIVDFSEYCELMSDIGYLDSTIIVSNPESFDLVSKYSYFKLNDELMSFLSISGNVVTVSRGIDDTIPHKHISGSKLWFIDEFSTADETIYFGGQTVAAKLLTNTGSDVLLINEAPTISTTMESRAFRPYPPANIKINGVYYPDTVIISNNVDLTWVNRNRLQQTAVTHLSWFDDGVVLESGVSYSLELSSDGVVLFEQENITTNSFSIPNTVLLQNKPHNIKLCSVRDGFNSYQIFDHNFSVESVSLVLSATAEKDKVVGSTVPNANITVDVDADLLANMKFDGSSIKGKTLPNSTITIEVQD